MDTVESQITFTPEEKDLYIQSKGRGVSYEFCDDKQIVVGKGVASRRELIDLPYELVQQQIQALLGNLDSEMHP